MTNKVNISLADASFARLEALKDATESESYSEVLSNALRLYEALIKQADEGCTFIVRHANGTEEEREIFK